MVKTLITAFFVFISTAYARESCTAHGLLHLVDPGFPVYCQIHGKTHWALTYDTQTHQLIMLNTKSRQLWYKPFQELSGYRERAIRNGSIVDFKLQTGAMEDEYWVPVEFTGVD